MELRTPYSHDNNEWSDRWTLTCKDKTRTQQQFKDSCNINKLFAKYLETGEMPQVINGLSYGDFTGIFDFATAMNAVRRGQEVFMELPARIKNKFDNDPQKLLTWLADKDNFDEACKLGLLEKRKPANDTGTPTPSAGPTQSPPGTPGTTPAAGPGETNKTT